MHGNANIRSGAYFVAQTTATCWRCGGSTALYALAVPPGHATLGDEDSADAETAPPGAWSVAQSPALLFYVEWVSETVRSRLRHLAPSFEYGHREGDMDGCWANHCQRCGACLADHELFCEPDAAFVPTSAAGAKAIRLSSIGEPFEAFAAGYAQEPPFFDTVNSE